jgi:phosphohistidine phosphatase
VQLILIRHGISEDPAEFADTGKPDSERPLTKQGQWKMERLARGLRHSVPALDVLGSSPFRRAEQTARIVSRAFHHIQITTVPALAPAVPLDDVLRWLKHHLAATRIAIVGHEPQLGELTTWLVTGTASGGVEFRKGGACLLEFKGRASAGSGRLQWMLTPALLRDLAD